MTTSTKYQMGLGVWLMLPILTFLLAAAAHAGWLFTGWVLR